MSLAELRPTTAFESFAKSRRSVADAIRRQKTRAKRCCAADGDARRASGSDDRGSFHGSISAIAVVSN